MKETKMKGVYKHTLWDCTAGKEQGEYLWEMQSNNRMIKIHYKLKNKRQNVIV